MKKIAHVAAILAFSGIAAAAAGCSAGPQQDVGESTQTVNQELLAPFTLYGSDTLKNLIISANGPAGANTDIEYEGRGSGVGQNCIRNGQSGFCTAGYQSIAPMSRDFTAGACNGGGGSTGTVCPGERSNVVGLDAVNVWTATAEAVTNINLADVKALFCGAANGNPATLTYPTGCAVSYNDGHGNSSTPDLVFRRDDNSGTTDVFKDRTGCQSAQSVFSFCEGVIRVTDAGGSVQAFQSGAGGVETAVDVSAICSGSDSATTCIGKLTSTSSSLGLGVGYSGDSAQTASNKKLAVNDIASSKANIRNLITGGTPVFPLARRLFLNESTTGTSNAEETAFYNWLYNGTTANKTTFEGFLTGQGFFTCDDSAPLKCGNAGSVNGCNLDDGRGMGAAKSNVRCVR